jgi:3'(2'), 5'-bisphosphate nucleotidase
MPSVDDTELAALLAKEAGELLVDLRASSGQMHPDRLRAEGDRRSHMLLLARLRELRPHDGVLSEEGIDDRTRLRCRRVWIVDPLDGTREYGEAGRQDWAVHVALALDGVAAIGAVALPASGLVLRSDAPLRLQPAPTPPVVMTSRTRHPWAATAIAAAMGASLVPRGSAGAKAMDVVTGEATAYAHAGGMYEWDSAAPCAVAAAAGLHVSRIDGSPLLYNRADPWLPDLLICRPEVADACLEALEGGGW